MTTKKLHYVAPSVSIIEVEAESIICGSVQKGGVTVTGPESNGTIDFSGEGSSFFTNTWDNNLNGNNSTNNQ